MAVELRAAATARRAPSNWKRQSLVTGVTMHVMPESRARKLIVVYNGSLRGVAWQLLQP